MGQGKATRDRKDDPKDEEDESDIVSVDEKAASDADDEKWENVNRIKIVPPTEERPQGSIGAIVVKKMLIQFDETREKEKKQLLLKRKFPKLMGQEEETEIEDRDGEKEEEEEEPAKSLGTKHLEDSNRKTRMLIHDLSGPTQRMHSRKRRRQQQENVLSSFSTEDIKKLPADSKVHVMNRRTGRLMPEKVPISELHDMLVRDAALEPITSTDKAQVSRTDPRATISMSIRRQTRSKYPLVKGEYVSIKEGPKKGKIYIFQEHLAGCYALLKSFPPRMNGDLVVHKDYIVRIKDDENLNRKRRLIGETLSLKKNSYFC